MWTVFKEKYNYPDYLHTRVAHRPNKWCSAVLQKMTALFLVLLTGW